MKMLLNMKILIGALIMSTTLSSAHAICPVDPNSRTKWFVNPSASASDAKGSIRKPLANVSQIDSCSSPGDKIILMPSLDKLVGPLSLKPGQHLKGLGINVTLLPEVLYDIIPHPQLTGNITDRDDPNFGAAIVMADDVRIKNVHVRDVPTGRFRGGITSPNDTVTGLPLSIKGDIKLKNILLTKSDSTPVLDFFSGGGIVIFYSPTSDSTNSIKLTNVKVKSIREDLDNDYALDISPDHWLERGVDIRTTSTCDNADVDVILKNVVVQNTDFNAYNFQADCMTGKMNAKLTHVKSINSTGDHLLLRSFGFGTIDMDINKSLLTNHPAVRDGILEAKQNSALSLPISSFGLELFGFVDTFVVKMRNSEISNGIGPALSILSFGSPFPLPVSYVVDLGCVDEACGSDGELGMLGYTKSPGNNVIYNNIKGRLNTGTVTDFVESVDYARALIDERGLKAFNDGFIGPDGESIVDSSAGDNAGKTVEIYLDGYPSDNAVYAQGNYWGDDVDKNGLGQCMQLNIQNDNMIVPDEEDGSNKVVTNAFISQLNSDEFNAHTQWRCTKWNALNRSGTINRVIRDSETGEPVDVVPTNLTPVFAPDPITNHALQYRPH